MTEIRNGGMSGAGGVEEVEGLGVELEFGGGEEVVELLCVRGAGDGGGNRGAGEEPGEGGEEAEEGAGDYERSRAGPPAVASTRRD